MFSLRNRFLSTPAIEAAGWSFLGFFIYSCTDLAVKYLSATYSVGQIIFLTGAFGTAAMCMVARTRVLVRPFFSSRYDLQLLRGVLIFLLTACYVHGFKLGITLAEFYVIVFTTPFIATLLSALFLKERTGIRHWLVILAGFSAVLIIAQPVGIGLKQSTLTVLLGALFSASAVLIIRYLGPRENVFLYSFIPHVFFIVGSLPFWPDFLWPARHDWVIFALAAVGSSAAGFCVAAGFAKAPSTAAVAPWNYTQLVWGIVFGWLFFKDAPGGHVFIGGAIVVIAGVYHLYLEANPAD